MRMIVSRQPGQRCRANFRRNVAAPADKSGRGVLSAFIATAFAQPRAEAASILGHAVTDPITPEVPTSVPIMGNGEHDVLAYMTFPKEHRTKLQSVNPIERLKGEIVRPTGALLIEQNDEWAVQRAIHEAGNYRTSEQ